MTHKTLQSSFVPRSRSETYYRTFLLALTIVSPLIGALVLYPNVTNQHPIHVQDAIAIFLLWVGWMNITILIFVIVDHLVVGPEDHDS